MVGYAGSADPPSAICQPAAGSALSDGAAHGRSAEAEPDQAALDVVAAPVAQHVGRLFVLHPFGHGLDVEAAGEVDQGVHEGAVVGGAGDVLHEGAVDLRRCRRRACAGCGTRCSRRRNRRWRCGCRNSSAGATKPRTSSMSWIATVSVISTISRSATPGWALHERFDSAHQSGSMVVSGEMLRLSRISGAAASSATTSSSTR